MVIRKIHRVRTTWRTLHHPSLTIRRSVAREAILPKILTKGKTRMKNYRGNLFALALLWAVLGQQNCQAEVFVQHQNIVYAESSGVGLIMDVFVPKDAQNGRAIVDVVSGGWSSSRGKIRDHKRAQVFHVFCKRGYTVFAIRPGSLSKFTGQEMLDHVYQGIHWVKENAERYEVDPHRIGLIGASAGGHLASLAAIRARDDAQRVACVGVFFPPTDLLQLATLDEIDKGSTDLGRMLRGMAIRLRTENATQEKIKQRLIDLSPARLVSGDEPPFLLIHGDADKVVPLAHSENLVAALQAQHVPVELIVKAGGGHPWLTLPVEVERLAEWMDQQLKP